MVGSIWRVARGLKIACRRCISWFVGGPIVCGVDCISGDVGCVQSVDLVGVGWIISSSAENKIMSRFYFSFRPLVLTLRYNVVVVESEWKCSYYLSDLLTECSYCGHEVI